MENRAVDSTSLRSYEAIGDLATVSLDRGVIQKKNLTARLVCDKQQITNAQGK